MTIESLTNTVHATPFRPFLIHMADGRSFLVPHPDFIAFKPQGRTAILYHLADEGWDAIDLLLAVSIEVPEQAVSR